MENKIKKIILSQDEDKKLIGILALTNDGISKFGYDTTTSQADLNPEYQELVRSLIKENAKELQNLDTIQIVQKLQELGKIVVSRENLITKITYFDDDSQFIIERIDGEEIIKNTDDTFLTKYHNALSELRNSYNMSSSELEECNLIEINDVKNKSDRIVKNLSIRSKVIKGLSLATAAVVLVTAGMKIQKLTTKNKDSEKNQNSLETQNPNQITLEPVATEMVSELPTLEPTQFNYNVASPIISFPTREFESDTLALDIYTDTLIPYYYSEKNNTDEEELVILKNVYLANMSNLASHIQNSNENSLNYPGKVIYFEKLFHNPVDIAYISYFTRLSNEIIFQVYYENSFDKAREYINVANYEALRCIKDNQPIEVEIDGQIKYISFSDISKEAQDIVLNIVYGTYFLLNRDTVEYNGVVYDQSMIAEAVFSLQEDEKSK